MGKKSKKAKRKSDKTAWWQTWSMVQLDADLEAYWAKGWAKAVRAYEKNPKDFFSAWLFLENHPANTRRYEGHGRAGAPYSWFMENMNVAVVKVDPATERISSHRLRNTATQVWVEWGPYMEPGELGEGWEQGCPSHDIRCDTGGVSFEEAVVNLAHNVYVLYGASARVADDVKLRKRDRW